MPDPKRSTVAGDHVANTDRQRRNSRPLRKHWGPSQPAIFKTSSPNRTSIELPQSWPPRRMQRTCGRCCSSWRSRRRVLHHRRREAEQPANTRDETANAQVPHFMPERGNREHAPCNGHCVAPSCFTSTFPWTGRKKEAAKFQDKLSWEHFVSNLRAPAANLDQFWPNVVKCLPKSD